ncbi:DUF881 domain-containing protein [Desulfotomaculum copahuensis]|uniref:Division initiation protein n=1 Tax=Desulfotomaculum copahuensis TaxID=1838280 RepID=A0A1B7LES3_9FIRM|nr:DUF881 domain-containing protein [Desulfotomaculum copahuensis]OAT81800.1 hypothetical protein A6M21_10410 [Desulfotomaculum copahuensis]
MKRSVFVSVSLVALVLGLMIAIQFRANNSAGQGVPAGRSQELLVELHQLEKDNEKLRSDVNDLNNKLQQSTKGQPEAVAAMEDELDKSRLAAGLVAVTGPGIEVTLDNPPQTVGSGGPASLFVIRDEDLLRLVNELRSAGAEALSINGQRIVSTTEIRLAAPFIDINLTRVVPPYHILAIGKPDDLKSTLEIPGGIDEILRDLGVQIKIQKLNQLTVPGFAGQLNFRYAKPA